MCSDKFLLIFDKKNAYDSTHNFCSVWGTYSSTKENLIFVLAKHTILKGCANDLVSKKLGFSCILKFS